MTTYLFTLSCPDQPGIVAAVSTALHTSGANILTNHQFTDPVSNIFVMRTRFELVDHSEAHADAGFGVVKGALSSATASFNAKTKVRLETDVQRMMIMVSKFDHCLVDLLYRWRAGELHVAIPLVVSNHPDLAPLVESFGIEFKHVAVTKDTKPAAEAEVLELAAEYNIDFVVLARYMQVLSNDFCASMPGRIINIHHSFLPGFKGAKPYHQAKERGVKLIGATAHYVTSDLDEGPIIHQAVQPVTHAQSAEDMVIVGKDVERLVLSTAVKAHAEDRVFLIDTATVVF
jgi:formyltetrahydrofolate deformylase